MPMQFWMSAGATMAVATIMGLGLGNYAISQQGPSPADQPVAESTYDGGAPLVDTAKAETGPAVIHCTGCGPTLAERRWKADMAGLDSDGMIYGSTDPIVQDYQAQEKPENILPDAESSPKDEMPPQIARFAAEDAAPRTILRASAEVAPPPVVATVVSEPQI